MAEGAICVAIIGNRRKDRSRKNEKNAKRVSMLMGAEAPISPCTEEPKRRDWEPEGHNQSNQWCGKNKAKFNDNVGLTRVC